MGPTFPSIKRYLWIVPHEWLHYIILSKYGGFSITYSDENASRASVDGEFTEKPPVTAVRIAAIFPTICFTLVGGLVDLTVNPNLELLSPLVLLYGPPFFLWIKWAHPSHLDVSVFYNAGYFAEKGNLTIDYDLTIWPKLASILYLLGLSLYGSWIIAH